MCAMPQRSWSRSMICSQYPYTRWLCDAVVGSWPIGCEFNPGSGSLFGETGSTSLILVETCG